MLEERGYNTTKCSSFLPVVKDDVKEPFDEIKLQKTDEIIIVRYILKLDPKKLPEIIDNMAKKNAPILRDMTIVFITNELSENDTDKIRGVAGILSQKHNVYIQIIPFSRLLFNITKHKLVPKHTRITKKVFDKDYTDFLDTYHINSLDKLPSILSTDPVASFIGLRPGELCKIERFSETSGKYITYRLCC
tara:strand:+ start:4549 stop:5121 length:573 start_codon:yes stop_codon:yes gene_type:complete